MFAENQGKNEGCSASGLTSLGNTSMTVPQPPKQVSSCTGVGSAYKMLDEQSRQIVEHAIRIRREFSEGGPIQDVPEQIPQDITHALSIVNARLELALRNLFQIEDALNS